MLSASRCDTIVELLDHLAATRGSHSALLSPGYAPLNFLELAILANRCAQFLASGGLNQNSRVALVLPQSPTALTALLGVSSYCIAVPLNPDYTAQELRKYLARCRANALMVAKGTSDQASITAEKMGLPVIELKASAPGTCGQFSLQWRASQGYQPAPDRKQPAADNIALLLHTSGSTAEPKLVPLTHTMLCQSAGNVARSLALNRDDICLSMLPQFHIGALVDLLLAPMLSEGKVAVAPDLNPATFFDCLADFQPTWFQATPALLNNILAHADREQHPGTNSSLRLIRSVSSPLPADILALSERLFRAPVIDIYGMTETAGVITSNPLCAARRKPGSVGVSAGPDIRILAADGGPTPTGCSGEIIVRGDTIMAGYESELPEEAGAVQNGWFKTGDQGYLDRDGHLFIVGRIKDIINRGGEKISPAEIDAQLCAHSSVADGAAFAVPHDSLGEDIAVAVVVRAGHSLHSEDLVDFLRSRLAPHKIPRQVFFTAKLPRSGAGKLMRGRIIEQLGGAAAVAERPEYVAPGDPLQRDIAALWERALGRENIGLEDDFFALGGDSLSATTFIVDLQEQLKLYVNAADLFDHPTLRAFCAAMDTARAPDRSMPDGDGDTLSPAIHRELLALTSNWPGQRRTAESLLVGRNLSGDEVPLFWCVQANLELNKLQNHLGRNQPLYGMRTLFRARSKSEANSRRVASHYRAELETLYPAGPIRIGGFCAGARIAFQIAQELQRGGRDVQLLCLQEQVVRQPYQGRVALFFSRPCFHNQLHWYHRPELGWAKFYGSDFAVHHCDVEHRFYYREPWIQQMVEQLKSELKKATDCSAPVESSVHKLPNTAYRARIESSAIPAQLRADATLELELSVTNISNTCWPSAPQSGLLLAARWLNAAGEPRGFDCGMAAHCSLPSEMLPGDTINTTLSIPIPRVPGKVVRMLDIDMVDDGICWFADEGSQSLRKCINLSPATSGSIAE